MTWGKEKKETTNRLLWMNSLKVLSREKSLAASLKHFRASWREIYIYI